MVLLLQHWLHVFHMSRTPAEAALAGRIYGLVPWATIESHGRLHVAVCHGAALFYMITIDAYIICFKLYKILAVNVYH